MNLIVVCVVSDGSTLRKLEFSRIADQFYVASLFQAVG